MDATERTASAMRPHSSLNAPDTNNATWFNYKEETEGYWMGRTDWYRTVRYSYYQHLAEINRGRKRGGKYWNTPYHTYQLNRDWIEIVSGNLNLLPRQQEVAKRWFTHFDLNKWGLPAELMACCLCARIIHEDDDDIRRTHPNVPDDQKPAEFAELGDKFGVRESEVRSTYGKIDAYLRDNSATISRNFDQRDLDTCGEHHQVTPADKGE